MAKMVYEVKIYRYKRITKTETKGNIFIFKEYKRWVCTSKEYCETKAFALREIRLCLSMDKEEIKEGVYFPQYKYSIRLVTNKKGGKKRGKR